MKVLIYVFRFYVLEHLVYPEQALREMMRVIKPKGHLLLVFPDFIATGRFPSQQLGFSPIGRASERIKNGRIFDGLVSLYDSRVRLPKALKQSQNQIGTFPVNTRPLCLSYPNIMSADVDAIYIASKQEIYNWAVSQKYKVEYPFGTQGDFCEHSCVMITK